MDYVCSSAYAGPTCEIQLSAYFAPSTAATLDLDPESDLTQISFQQSVVQPSGVVFHIVSLPCHPVLIVVAGDVL